MVFVTFCTFYCASHFPFAAALAEQLSTGEVGLTASRF